VSLRENAHFVAINPEALRSCYSEERGVERDFSPAVIPSGARDLSTSSIMHGDDFSPRTQLTNLNETSVAQRTTPARGEEAEA
jgi:hypothetical protein